MNHILYTPGELTNAMMAKAFVQRQDLGIKFLLTDSRKLIDPGSGLFFALSGRRDGHSFIADAYKAGVRSFVISDKSFPYLTFSGCNFYLVNDSLTALQALVSAHRAKFDFPVIGITGSNGKTIVKEWLFQLLAPGYNIVRSPKSYNSQLGVPLSVWEMSGENDLGIFEAGISRFDEMLSLAHVIQPTIGIFTNIGEAHREGFNSQSEKLSEKLKLFEGVDLFIYPARYFEKFVGELPGKTRFNWGSEANADLQITSEKLIEGRHHLLRGNFNGKEVETSIPFSDQASLENAITCWATMLALGYDPLEASKRLEKLQPIGMRLELKSGVNNCSVIDDSYSFDLSSLAIALDFLSQQNQYPRRTLILSDLPGSGSTALYQRIGQMLKAKSVHRLIGIGPLISQFGQNYDLDKHFYSSTSDFIAAFPSIPFANETILLKGARSFEFERISLLLTQKVHETVLEINLNALEHNLNYYKSQLPERCKIMAMVKAFSYGSGSFEITNLLEFTKVDYLAVAYADEGVSLRKSGTKLPIMVMSPDVMAFDTMIEHQLEPEIFSPRIFEEFALALDRKEVKDYPVHLKFDTGMHRLGFMENEMDQLLDMLEENHSFRISSVFSHLVASEDAQHDDFTRQQIELFTKMAHSVSEKYNYPILRHLANTSGISRWPVAAFDMVRLGIGLYGIDTSLVGNSPLQTVTSLKTSISQIKQIPAGDSVGYSRAGYLPQGGTIATVKIGYADGYSRKLGNGVGKMIVRGQEVKTIGKICMDMCMIDITGINAEEGDEVVVFNDVMKVEDIARQTDTIAYEVLTGISQRVKRIYYYE